MSGIRNKHTTNRKGRPKRNITALQQSHLKETHHIAESTLFDSIDVTQPLTITRISSAQKVKQEHEGERDLNISDSNMLKPVDSELSDLSSEDDTLLTTPPVNTMTHVQGVNLSRLPQVHFTPNTSLLAENTDNSSDEESIYEQQQKEQEEHLLAQHYQMYQQPTPTVSNVKHLLQASRIFNRPENHYIHYIEPSDVELYDLVEYDMDEQDQSWLKLYNKERRKDLLGDISPYLFECIMDKLEKEWFNLIKNAPKPQVEVLLPEDSACAVCDDTEVENSNAIVFCDGCNVAVHQDCYGIPYIPEGQWLCRKCMISPEYPVSCIFCPNEGGAFKQTNTNQWGHLLCAIWIPEVGVSNAIYMEPIDMIENIPKSRWKLTCCICRKRQGACIQCDNKHCFAAFHVTCAKAAKLCMKMNSHQSQTEGVILKAYCDKHTPKEHCKSVKNEEHEMDSAASVSSMSSDESQVKSETTTGIGRGRGRGRGRGNSLRGRARGGGRHPQDKRHQQQQFSDNKVARAHQLHYSTGAPIAPDIILAKLDNLACVRLSGVRKRPELVTDIAHYWSLKRESRRGAPLLKRLHLEPWTAISKQSEGGSDHFIRKMAIKKLRADLDVVRMLSEQVKKRERYKLEQTRRIKDYLDMLFFPLEHVLRPILKQFMEIDRKKLFLNPVNAQEVPDYYTVIQHPMCFSEILHKLNSHTYTNVQEFQHDIQLIWQNCMAYNASHTSFYKVAKKLEAASVKLFTGAKAKMERLQLVDGMWDEPIDEAIFEYDVKCMEIEPNPASQHHQQEPKLEVNIEEQLERERIREQKERDRQRAIEARVQGRARARALREENRLKGIVVQNPIAQKAQLRTLQKLRTRKPSSSASIEQLPQKSVSIPIQKPIFEETVTASTTDSIPVCSMETDARIQYKDTSPPTHLQPSCPPMEALLVKEKEVDNQNQRDKEIHALKIIEQQQEYTTALPSANVLIKTEAQSADMMDTDQISLANERLTNVQQEQGPKRIADASTIAQSDTTVLNGLVSIEASKGNSPTALPLEPKPDKSAKTVPAKRRLKSTSLTPRLTRSAGLQASIEEITKRRKISQEARSLFASYNGVSHLEKPVEVYKENRKKHAPVGWVYVDEDDEEGEGALEPAAPPSQPSASKKPSRNDIPVPNFQRGEIVWAKVNRYPSHPAKFLNLSDEDADPKLVASRRYAGDILVEFLKVPPNHQFGWVGRRTICEVGDPEVDRARLSESLTMKGKRSMFIQEAKEGYRAAGEILGLDPEPLLAAVFDTPLPKKQKKRPHNKKSKA